MNIHLKWLPPWCEMTTSPKAMADHPPPHHSLLPLHTHNVTLYSTEINESIHLLFTPQHSLTHPLTQHSRPHINTHSPVESSGMSRSRRGLSPSLVDSPFQQNQSIMGSCILREREMSDWMSDWMHARRMHTLEGIR